MSSSRLFAAFGAFVAALALRAAMGCGTEPCFRHSDCASSEICSSGSCIPAPIDVPITPIDGSIDVTSDASTPPVDTGTTSPDGAYDAPILVESGEAASDASDASDTADASDAPSESTADAAAD